MATTMDLVARVSAALSTFNLSFMRVFASVGARASVQHNRIDNCARVHARARMDLSPVRRASACPDIVLIKVARAGRAFSDTRRCSSACATRSNEFAALFRWPPQPQRVAWLRCSAGSYAIFIKFQRAQSARASARARRKRVGRLSGQSAP